LLLHFSGGIENPIYFFYLFHVVLSGIVFPKKLPFVFSTLVVFLFFLLIYLEYAGILPHYTLFNTKLYADREAIELTLSVFAITVYVTTYICMTFMQIYRKSKQVIDLQNKKLREVHEQKMNFFRFASHELKSPLVAVKTSIDSVLGSFGDKMEPVAVDLLQRSSSRAEQMLAIIKDLLELSQSGEMIDEAEIESIDPLKVLDEIVVQEKVLAEAKHIDLIIEKPSRPVRIPIRKVDLERILRNLINNAIRYTPEQGKVWVRVQAQKGKFVLEVKDTGIGIAEDELPKIFDEFFRSQNAKKMVNFGTGLGLSLVKQLVERYQGKIRVTSQLNKGTTFIVELPLGEEKQKSNGDA
jgi:signal transduction histidine kinase